MRVILVAGRSDREQCQFVSGAAEVRLRVGSGADCDWRVLAAGVEGAHFELVWAADTLWIGEIGEGCDVRIDGLPVDTWHAVDRGAEVAFGAAAVRVRGDTNTDAGEVATAVVDLASLQRWAVCHTLVVEEAPELEVTQVVGGPPPGPAQGAIPPGGSPLFAPAGGGAGVGSPAQAAPDRRPVRERDPEVPFREPITQPATLDELFAVPPPTPPARAESEDVLAFKAMVQAARERVAGVVTRRLALALVAAVAIVSVALLQSHVRANGQRRRPAPVAAAPASTPARARAPVSAAEAPDPKILAELEHVAARELAAGRFDRAAAAYEKLAALDPADDAYAVVLKVLRRSRPAACQGVVSTGGQLCAAVP